MVLVILKVFSMSHSLNPTLELNFSTDEHDAVQPGLRSRPLSQCDTLCRGKLSRIRNELRKHFTRVWPTRRLALCPPAAAAVVKAGALMPLLEPGSPTADALVVVVPDDCGPSLVQLAQQTPQVRVHTDVGQTSRGAYLCWRAERLGRLALEVWIDLQHIKRVVDGHRNFGDSPLQVHVVFMTSTQLAMGEFSMAPMLAHECQQAIDDASAAPSEVDEATLAKARDKAEKYGERPWLHMLYELATPDGRVAVHWAPCVGMYAKT